MDGDGDGEEIEEHWPGLESLPPEPPVEYPPPRPFRRRWRREPEIQPYVAPVAASSAPRPPSPARSSSRALRALLAIAIVMLLVLVPALFLLGRDREQQARARDSITTTTTTTTTVASSTTTAAPSTTTTAPPPTTTTSTLPPVVVPPDGPLTATINEISEFVEAHRGLTFGEPIVGVRLADEEFEARVRENYDRQQLEAEGSMLKLQGIIPQDTDYVTEFLETAPKQTAAFYQPTTKQIVLRGEPGTPVGDTMRSVLAHELTHALDDHRFDFGSYPFDDPEKEQRFGFEALVEGDAVRIQHQWDAHAGTDPYEVGAGYGDVVSSRLLVKYHLGEALVEDIVRRGGQAELDTDFEAPPWTSEQVMHPDKWATKEAALDVAIPDTAGPAVWVGVIGEYTTGQMLAPSVEQELADEVAAGWGGDLGSMWVQAPAEGGLTCLRIAYRMDTPTDLDDLRKAFEKWAADAPDRTVSEGREQVIVTMCAPVPPPPPPPPPSGPSKA